MQFRFSKHCVILGSCALLYGFYQWSLPFWQTPPTFKPTNAAAEKVQEQQPVRKLYTSIPKQGEQLGTLKIPSIQSELTIFQGSHENELARGVGHYYRSALPGEKDNVVLGGHRDGVFSKLKDVKVGDQIVIETVAGKFTYEVKDTRIVDKDDKTIIRSTYPQPKLSVVTCYPFTFIGSAPKRYILICDLVDAEIY
jgi:sortase A